MESSLRLEKIAASSGNYPGTKAQQASCQPTEPPGHLIFAIKSSSVVGPTTRIGGAVCEI